MTTDDLVNEIAEVFRKRGIRLYEFQYKGATESGRVLVRGGLETRY